MDLSQIQKIVFLKHLLRCVVILVKNDDIHHSNTSSVERRLTPAHSGDFRDVRVDVVLRLLPYLPFVPVVAPYRRAKAPPDVRRNGARPSSA